jgi:hypothetical protein
VGQTASQPSRRLLRADRYRLLAFGPNGPLVGFFLGTVRPGGRPDAAGVGAVWHDGGLRSGEEGCCGGDVVGGAGPAGPERSIMDWMWALAGPRSSARPIGVEITPGLMVFSRAPLPPQACGGLHPQLVGRRGREVAFQVWGQRREVPGHAGHAGQAPCHR